MHVKTGTPPKEQNYSVSFRLMGVMGHRGELSICGGFQSGEIDHLEQQATISSMLRKLKGQRVVGCTAK
jgi:hypothetical protein